MNIPLTYYHAFWDALLAVMIGCMVMIGAAAALYVPMNALADVVLGLSIIGCITLLYGSFIEPKRIVVNKKSILLPLPSLRIAVVSDMHIGPYKGEAFVKNIVTRVNALKPDVIFLVGDFIEHHRADLSPLRPLKHLQARNGIFAVMGNHDAGQFLRIRNNEKFTTVDRTAEISTLLEACGVTVLRNASKKITLESGKSVSIAGIDDLWMDGSDLDRAIGDIPRDEPIILLSHNPDVILDPRSSRASLIVSGHTHGGQIRLPFIGPVSGLPDRLGRKFDQGIFSLDNGTTLAISHGIGETQARARLFCPPEILLLEITST